MIDIWCFRLLPVWLVCSCLPCLVTVTFMWRPCGPQPSRPLCSWDSLGKNTGEELPFSSPEDLLAEVELRSHTDGILY